MSSRESTLVNALRFVSIAVLTFMLVTGGMWLAKQPKPKKSSASKNSSPAHWMFWLVGLDLEEELRNPRVVFDPGTSVVPAWDRVQAEDFARVLNEDQQKRDRMMDEIRATWGPR